MLLKISDGEVRAKLEVAHVSLLGGEISILWVLGKV